MARAYGLAALLWLVTLPLPARETPAPASLRDYVLKNQARHAYGLYLAGKKAGWEIDEIKLGKHDGKDVAVNVTETYLAHTFDGQKTIAEDRTTICYELEGEGAIVFAEVRAKENDKLTVRKAVRKGKGLLLSTTTASRTTERTIPLPKDTLALQRKFDRWLGEPRRKGDAFENYSTSWEEDDVDTKEIYTFKEKKTILWGGVKTEVFAVQSLSQGLRTDYELLPDGKMLTGKIGVLVEARLEKEVTAKKLDGDAVVDLLSATCIVVDKNLGNAATVEKLRLHVQGLDDYDLPRSHRQRLTPGKDGSVLELARDFRVDTPTPLPKEERARYVAATASIQSDHETIRNLARKIVGDEKDPIKVVTLLEKWVYQNLKPTYTDNADNALAVLDNKAGDCTEHTLLFVALARAVGVPAREVGGVGFVNAGKPLFGWHAWAEIHDGSQWVTVDPTWDQVYIDATHIKFSEGSQDFAWVNVAGKLKMKVINFEKKK